MAEEGVDGKEAGAEDKDEQSGEPVGVGIGGVELVGRGEEVVKASRSAVQKATVMLTKRMSETRREPMPKARRMPPMNSTRATKRAVGAGAGRAREAKNWVNVSEMVELAPAGDGKLPSPVEADEQQERALGVVGEGGEGTVGAFDEWDDLVHIHASFEGGFCSGAQIQPSSAQWANHGADELRAPGRGRFGVWNPASRASLRGMP